MEKLCSYCRLAGHHHGKCPLFQSDVAYIEKFREVKTEYERKILYEHLPIGSIVGVTKEKAKDQPEVEILCVPVSYTNLDKDCRVRMDSWTIEKPLFTKYNEEHTRIVNRLFNDRKWKSAEEKLSSVGVYLLGIGGKKLVSWSKDPDKPDWLSFAEVNYDIRRGRIKIISPS